MTKAEFRRRIERALESKRRSIAMLVALQRGDVEPKIVKVRAYRVRAYSVRTHERIIMPRKPR